MPVTPNPYPSGTEPGQAGTNAARSGASQKEVADAATKEAESSAARPPANEPKATWSDTAAGAVADNFAPSAWLAPVFSRLGFGLNVTGAFVLGIALVIIGVVILMRRPLGAVASIASPGKKAGAAVKVAGKVSNAAKAVGAVNG